MVDETVVEPEAPKEEEAPKVEGEEGKETPEEKPEETPETAEEKAKKEKDERSFDKMQERIDEIARERAEEKAEKEKLLKKIEELEKKSTPEDKTPKYTENDLYAILADPAQAKYHPFAVNELIQMGISKYDQKKQKENGVSATIRQSAERALEEFPDLEDHKSELFAKATKIFDEHGLKDNPNGTYLAAKMAAAELNKDKGETKEQLEKKLARLTKKSSLAGGGTKPQVNPNASYDKLKAEALKAGFGSGKWNEWQKALMARKKK